MPNSRHSEAIVSPSLSRITNRIRSSITELSFHGILLSAPFGPKSVTHVSGTFCYLCLGTDIQGLAASCCAPSVRGESAATRGFAIGFLLSHDCGGLDSAPPLLSVRFQSV